MGISQSLGAQIVHLETFMYDSCDSAQAIH